MSMIELRGVSKAFRRRPAVENLSLDVPRGSIFGLLGHNGAGKSTTLGMVLGQVFPDAGELRVHGFDVFKQRNKALAKVGAIFESPVFYDYLSGRRNLRIFCDYTAPATRDRIDEVVELVNLTERIDHPVGNYSHGMRQRLALAQALLPDPETLILDEPSDGLDPVGIADMRNLVLRLNREFGLTILFSSHLLPEVQQLCTDLAVMHRGKLVFSGDWADAGGNQRYFELEVDRRDEAVALLRESKLIDETIVDDKLTLAKDADTATVNRLLVERGFAVTGIAPVKLSLEDFYLQLVRRAEDGRAA